MLGKVKNIVKWLLAISWIRKAYESINKATLSVFSSNRLFASLYTLLGFLTFNREQYAVLKGRYRYYKNLNKERNWHVELRRNIHRLEKGMVMHPRRDVFAEDYIVETLEFYERAVKDFEHNPDTGDRSELEWAYDVLNEYFSITKATQIIGKAKEQFENIDFSKDEGLHKKPFRDGDRKDVSVAYDDLLALSVRRRSVRWFEQKPVPRELIDKAMLVARQSPTACNRLPYEFKIYDDPELVKKVSSVPFGAGGYSHNIPTVIVVVGKLDSYFSPRDRHVVYIDASLAAMPFMYALESLGLSSSVINWPDFEPLEHKMQKTIGLSVDERPIMLIAVGYPDKDALIPYSQKKNLNSIRTYNDLGRKV